MLINKAYVDQTALAHERSIEALTDELVQLVFILACMLVRVPKVALDLGYDSTHGGKEGSQGHLVSIARIDRLACL